MAYSSVRATLGGKDVRKTTRQVKPAPVRTVSSITGAKSYKPTRSKGSYSVSSSGAKTYYGTTSSGASAPSKPAGPSKAKVRERKQRAQIVKQVRKRLSKAAERSRPGLASKLDRPFKPGETITPKETAILAESEGLPGITYAKAIAPGESGHQPGIPNPDDATPSLFQITPSVQSATTQAKFDKIASKRPGGYSNPIVAAKQAKVLAKGSSDEGVSNYVAYNPSAPQGHLKGGPEAARRKLYGNPKPIPKKLKTRAVKVLGEQKTKKVIAKAQDVVSATPKKLPGGWEGSKKAVLSVVPRAVRAEGRGDKRTPEENASVGGSPTSDHLTTNKSTYAADLPPDDAIAKKIAAKLGMSSHTGTQEVTKDGYRYQLIWQDAGHYDHIHIGAEWTGEGTQPASGVTGAISALTGGSVSAPTGSSAVGSTAASTGAGTATKRVKRRGKSKRQKERERLLQEILAKPDRAPAPPSSVPLKTKTYTEYAKSRPVKVGLG